MLQAVYTEKGCRKASSLYCRWILVERKGGAQLVAVWIDSEMRAYEGQFHPLDQQTEQSHEEVPEGRRVLASFE